MSLPPVCAGLSRLFLSGGEAGEGFELFVGEGGGTVDLEDGDLGAGDQVLVAVGLGDGAGGVGFGQAFDLDRAGEGHGDLAVVGDLDGLDRFDARAGELGDGDAEYLAGGDGAELDVGLVGGFEAADGDDGGGDEVLVVKGLGHGVGGLGLAEAVDGDGADEGESDGAVQVVAAATNYDWFQGTVDCFDPYALWSEAAAHAPTFQSGPRKHLLVYLPRNTPGCAYGLAQIGSAWRVPLSSTG